MALPLTHQIPILSKLASQSDKLLFYKAFPWLATALTFAIGLPLLRTAFVSLLLKLYELFIQKNALRL